MNVNPLVILLHASFTVREDGMGFVRRYAEWLALQLERVKAQ